MSRIESEEPEKELRLESPEEEALRLGKNTEMDPEAGVRSQYPQEAVSQLVEKIVMQANKDRERTQEILEEIQAMPAIPDIKAENSSETNRTGNVSDSLEIQKKVIVQQFDEWEKNMLLKIVHDYEVRLQAGDLLVKEAILKDLTAWIDILSDKRKKFFMDSFEETKKLFIEKGLVTMDEIRNQPGMQKKFTEVIRDDMKTYLPEGIAASSTPYSRKAWNERVLQWAKLGIFSAEEISSWSDQ